MLEQSVNFDRAADYYDETRAFPDGIAPEVGAFVAEKLGFNQQTHLLEVGVGTGRIALPLLPHVGSITGFDISTQMMGKLRAKQGGETIRLTVADAHQMPFVADSFDAVYITHVLHLVKDPVQVLHEIKRVVKAGHPFIHMRNRYSNTSAMQQVVDAWNTATPEKSKGPKRWDNTDEALAGAGIVLDAEYGYTFPYISKLDDFLSRVEQRQWSSTWLMDDAVWQRGLDAIYKVIDEEFDGNRDFEAPTEGTFQVQVYRAQ